MYKNTSYDDDKYYYAYIENLEYVNDEMTKFNLKLDVFQTWQFDFIYKKSFVERKHVTNDSVGANTLPESVELGEYVTLDYEQYTDMNDFDYIVIVTKRLDLSEPVLTPMGRIPMAGGAYICDSMAGLQNLFLAYQSASASQTIPTTAIQQCYAVPHIFTNHIFSGQDVYEEYNGTSNAPVFYYQLSKPSAVDGYTPKNNKLLTFPYCFLLVSNNTGSSNIFHYEKFTHAVNDSDLCEFMIAGVPSVGGSIKCSPNNYTQSIKDNPEEGILAGKYPVFNWNQETYNDWLLANSSSLNVQRNTGRFQIGAGAISTVLGLGALIATAIGTGGASLALAGFGLTARWCRNFIFRIPNY